jgi:hypothetical protein
MKLESNGDGVTSVLVATSVVLACVLCCCCWLLTGLWPGVTVVLQLCYSDVTNNIPVV